jgi:hypothetical protein
MTIHAAATRQTRKVPTLWSDGRLLMVNGRASISFHACSARAIHGINYPRGLGRLLNKRSAWTLVVRLACRQHPVPGALRIASWVSGFLRGPGELPNFVSVVEVFPLKTLFARRGHPFAQAAQGTLVGR